MKCYTVFLFSLSVLLSIWFQSVSSEKASLPPRAWNSYDSFTTNISEAKKKLPFHTLVIVSCQNPDAYGWTTKGLNKDGETFCWKNNLHSLFCIPKKETWKLSPNGTVEDTNSRNCVGVHHTEDIASPPEIRSWITKGRKGDVYLAFSNQSKQKTTIYTQTSYLTEVFPEMHVKSCRGKELRSRKNVKTTHGALTVDVEAHGSTLLLLNCH